uniref:Uncharacterized protein n=1 Tax=Arundo donax TaxID=35708 RepID=A0A0A9EE35_ARUDO
MGLIVLVLCSLSTSLFGCWVTFHLLPLSSGVCFDELSY